MANREIGAGTTFNVTIPLPEAITEYVNILIALYTSASSPIRFSYVAKEGFNKLSVGATPLLLVGTLTGAQTANMKGELYMEMKVVDEVGADENIGNSIPTLVKDENGLTVELVSNTLKSVL